MFRVGEIDPSNSLKCLLVLIIALINCAKCEDNVETRTSNFLYKGDDLSASCNATLHSLSILNLLKMLDASGKIPDGLLELNLYELGHFDECYNIYEKVDNMDVYGKYCLGSLVISIPTPNSEEYKIFLEKNPNVKGQPASIPITIGYCLPSTCTSEDFHKKFNMVYLADQLCYTKAEEHELDASDIVAICFYAIFAAFAVLSTIYDVFLYYTEQKPKHDLLIAFSLWSNCRKLMKTSSGGGQLTCINGIKALSMMWVVYGHVSSFLLQYPVDNVLKINDFMRETKNMYLMAAPVSVDTFFAIGGILTIYTYMKSVEKGVKLNIPLFYIHRYLRLTPAFAAIIVYNATLIRYTGMGPIWGNVDGIIEPCRKYWWSALLYIQNYVNMDDMCTGQSWYLNTDMQLFVFTPLVLIPLATHPKYTLAGLFVLVIAGIASPFGLTYGLDIPASMFPSDVDAMRRYSDYYYFQTYARFGPYIIGMLFGYLIYNLKKNVESIEKMEKKKLILIISVFWIVALGGTYATTYGGASILTGETTDKLARALHNGFNRNAWSVAVCIIVTLCSIGYGGPINDFLSLPVFQFLAKISYSMYLTHISMIFTRLMSTKVETHFSQKDLIGLFWGDFMNTLVISFFFCAIFESPIIILEKFLFGHGKKESPPKAVESK